MPQEELTGKRDRTYSAWHRRNSTRRFVGIENAQLLSLVDLDMSVYVEYDDGTKEPLALIETAKDYGQAYKCATVTTNLAKRTVPALPCYVVLYKESTICNPCDPAVMDIECFRVKRLWPKPEHEWKIYTPQEWAENLLLLRTYHAKKLDQEFINPPYGPPKKNTPALPMDEADRAWQNRTRDYYKRSEIQSY